jgi:Na+-transporting methylmalonyl-CoA/oxaloacetate decarboxylase gamma subunit
MTDNLLAGLSITAIGMGLVFAAILLLWGLMALMVRIGAKPERDDAEGEESPSVSLLVEPAHSTRKLAAVAALAVALALKERSQTPAGFPPVEPASSWQQIQRAQALQEKSRLFSSRQYRRS